MGAIETAFTRKNQNRDSAQKADTLAADSTHDHDAGLRENRVGFQKSDSQTAGSTFTHEAEVQRQHSRHRIPVKVVLRDNIFKTTDWSLGGIGIDMSGIDWQEEFGDSLQVGDILPMELLFEFVGFKFSMSVHAEIRNWESTTQQLASTSPSAKSNLPRLSFDNDKEAGALQRMGLQFVDLTPQQIAFLRFLLDAFISGELVEAADLLEVAARVHPVAPRALPKREVPASAGGRLMHFGKRTAIWATVGLASLFLVAAVSASVYKRAFVIPAESAFVTADVIMVTAPTAGVLSTLPPANQDTVVRGSPIIGIDNNSSYGVTVDSPCNCRVVARKAKAGMYIKQGDILLVLAPDNTKPYALAHLLPNEALNLKRDTEVRVALGDGEIAVPGRIRTIRRHAGLWTGEQGDTGPWMPVEVVIDFTEELPLSAIGAPLAVEFDTFDDSRLGRLLKGALPGPVEADDAAVKSGPGNAG